MAKPGWFAILKALPCLGFHFKLTIRSLSPENRERARVENTFFPWIAQIFDGKADGNKIPANSTNAEISFCVKLPSALADGFLNSILIWVN